MAEMNSRQRILASLCHKEPDRTPIFEYILQPPLADEILERPYLEYLENADKWLGEAADIGLENAITKYVNARLDIAEKLGHDMLYVCPNPIPGERYYYDPLDEIGSHFTLNDQGDPAARLRERNDKVAEMLMEKLPDDSYLVFRELRREMQNREIDLPIIAPAYFHGIWTDADLMQAMLLDPEAARGHFSLATKRALSVINDYLDLGIDLIGIGGDFAGNRLMISELCYREFIVPEVRTCAERIREAGKYSINATDGDIWPVIDDFLIGCGVDGYLEIDMSAGMDLEKLKSRYGEKITFLGNMDCGNILSFSFPAEIEIITRQILEAGSGNGGHIFTASNAITASVPLKNYMTMVNTYRDYYNLSSITI
jgi:uroporphyrinogen-III decarboxylase